MAKIQKPHHLIKASTVLIFLLFASSSSSLFSLSSARVLHDDDGYIPGSLAITEPEAAFSIALPTDKAEALKKEAYNNMNHHRQQQGMETNDMSSSPKPAGKYYRPLVLNILPKGSVTPSGPSKGTNDVNN